MGEQGVEPARELPRQIWDGADHRPLASPCVHVSVAACERERRRATAGDRLGSFAVAGAVDWAALLVRPHDPEAVRSGQHDQSPGEAAGAVLRVNDWKAGFSAGLDRSLAPVCAGHASHQKPDLGVMADGAIGGQLGHRGCDSVLDRVGTGAARDLREPTPAALDLADEVDKR